MIEPNKKYTLYEIVNSEFFPWLTTKPQYRSAVLRDKIGDNILKSKTVNGVRGIQYEIKGENIIKYIEFKKNDKNTTNNS